MGFLRGIVRKLGSSSIVGKLCSSSIVGNGNLGPKLNFTSFGTVAGKPIYLEDVKLSGTMKQKKACLKDLVRGIIWRMSNGVEGGCMDPKKILVIDNRIRLPEDEFIVGKHPSYFMSLKDLVIHVHENDQMSPRERLKFDNFNIYLGLLSRM